MLSGLTDLEVLKKALRLFISSRNDLHVDVQ